MENMTEPCGQGGGPEAGDGRRGLFAGLLESRETVFRICLGFCRDARDAEELTQDVYVAAFVKLHTLQNPAARRAWLFRIARNVCLNHMRHTRHEPLRLLTECEPADGAATPEESLETREQLEALKDAIALLPRKMRDVFVMREYGQLGYEEIAGALGLRPGTVMSRLSRARALLNERMRSFNDG